MYWPAFEFRYRLDSRKLLPHITAVEAYKQAATTRVLPPQWREQPEGPATERSDTKNPAKTQKWVNQKFLPGSAPLSLDDILTMHRMVAEETKVEYKGSGALRNDPVQVGKADVGGIHVGAPAAQLHDAGRRRRVVLRQRRAGRDRGRQASAQQALRRTGGACRMLPGFRRNRVA